MANSIARTDVASLCVEALSRTSLRFDVCSEVGTPTSDYSKVLDEARSDGNSCSSAWNQAEFETCLSLNSKSCCRYCSVFPTPRSTCEVIPWFSVIRCAVAGELCRCRLQELSPAAVGLSPSAGEGWTAFCFLLVLRHDRGRIWPPWTVTLSCFKTPSMERLPQSWCAWQFVAWTSCLRLMRSTLSKVKRAPWCLGRSASRFLAMPVAHENMRLQCFNGFVSCWNARTRHTVASQACRTVHLQTCVSFQTRSRQASVSKTLPRREGNRARVAIPSPWSNPLGCEGQLWPVPVRT